jgi:hypothetical protein
VAAAPLWRLLLAAASIRACAKQWASQPLLLSAFSMRPLFIRKVPVPTIHNPTVYILTASMPTASMPTASIPHVSVLAIVTPAIEKPAQKSLKARPIQSLTTM